MNIGIYGGSFNPPHKGHNLFANYLVHKYHDGLDSGDRFYIDQLLICPAAGNPLKEEKDTIPYQYIVGMCREAFYEHTVFAFEHHLTKDLLKELRRIFPTAKSFTIFLGDDNSGGSVKNWEGIDEVLGLAEIVLVRLNHIIPFRWERIDSTGNGIWHESETGPDADWTLGYRQHSSLLRNLVRSKDRGVTEELLRSAVQRPVLHYIKEHNLYKEKK